MIASPKPATFFNLFLIVALAFPIALKAAGHNRSSGAVGPVTVDDAIAMTRLGDSDYFSGTPSKGRVAHFSPDASHFLVLLRKGNVQNNSNDFSLLLFRTANAFQSPQPDKLLEFSSHFEPRRDQGHKVVEWRHVLIFRVTDGRSRSSIYV